MRMFAGLDVGFKRTAVCVVDEAGRIVWRGRVRARSDLGCDFVKMQLHGLAVAGRQYEAAPVPRSSYRGFLDFLLVRDTDGHEKAMAKWFNESRQWPATFMPIRTCLSATARYCHATTSRTQSASYL